MGAHFHPASCHYPIDLRVTGGADKVARVKESRFWRANYWQCHSYRSESSLRKVHLKTDPT